MTEILIYMLIASGGTFLGLALGIYLLYLASKHVGPMF